METLAAQGLKAAVSKIKSLENLIGEAADIIEAYADDHNDEFPTDVTVLLPELRRASRRNSARTFMKGELPQEDLFVME